VRDVYFVVPDGIDDPTRPSGGNTYDRHLLRKLGGQGWSARECPVAGFWDGPDAAALSELGATLAGFPDGAVVLLDGLVASAAPEVLEREAGRLWLVVLVHMPFGHRPVGRDDRAREGAALGAAAAIVTTSAWTRRRLLELYDLRAERLHVAVPGAPVIELDDPAAAAPGGAGAASGDDASGSGGALLCVGTVSFEKGHDVLLGALEEIASLEWSCTCVGRLDRDPAFVERLWGRVLGAGLGERITLAGVRAGDDLDRAYAAADLLVVASRAETYGMVVTEALARRVPVVAADVGGVGEALGAGDDGTVPGLLVAPEDPVALADALRAWLGDPDLRARLRCAAAERRESLPRWSTTAAVVGEALAEAAASGPSDRSPRLGRVLSRADR
jgi:glycosyltransferase involved in cell wall biosynthesis